MPSPFRSASLTAPGSSRPVDLIGQHGRIAGAVVDDDAVETLVGVDDVLRAIAGQVGHGQLDGLVGLVVGLEGAVAVAQQHQHVAVGDRRQAGRACRRG